MGKVSFVFHGVQILGHYDDDFGHVHLMMMETELMKLSLKELKERTEAERSNSVIAVRARHLLVEVRGIRLIDDVNVDD